MAATSLPADLAAEARFLRAALHTAERLADRQSLELLDIKLEAVAALANLRADEPDTEGAEANLAAIVHRVDALWVEPALPANVVSLAAARAGRF